MLRRRWQRLWQEPMFAFLLLGAALFTVDRWLMPPPTTLPTTIRVTASQQAALAEAFRAERGRRPEPAELQTQLDRWINEQVLYREALALGLDQKDVIVQRQLTQKMRFLMEEAAPLPEPSDAQLQTWLQEHPERYRHPAILSFQQVFLGRARHGTQLSAAAEKLLAQLRQQPQVFVGLGDAFQAGQVLEAVDDVRLRREFGPDFAAQLKPLPLNQWSGPVASSFGLHLVRITETQPGKAATLEEVRNRVQLDYREAQRLQQRRAALQTLRQRYQIIVENSAP